MKSFFFHNWLTTFFLLCLDRDLAACPLPPPVCPAAQ